MINFKFYSVNTYYFPKANIYALIVFMLMPVCTFAYQLVKQFVYLYFNFQSLCEHVYCLSQIQERHVRHVIIL